MKRAFGDSLTVSAFNGGFMGRQPQCLNTFMTPVRTAALENVNDLSSSDLLTPREIEEARFNSFASTPLNF